MEPNGRFEMLSTGYYRTIQSGYSELAGLYDASGIQIPQLSDQQSLNLENESRGSVPFKTRKSKELEQQLGNNSIVDGFIGVPEYTHLIKKSQAPSWEDNLNPSTCK